MSREPLTEKQRKTIYNMVDGVYNEDSTSISSLEGDTERGEVFEVTYERGPGGKIKKTYDRIGKGLTPEEVRDITREMSNGRGEFRW